MSKLQVTTPEVLPEETSAEAALRPSRLTEFVGQEQVKASLQIAIDAAKGRRETLDQYPGERDGGLVERGHVNIDKDAARDGCGVGTNSQLVAAGAER